MLLRIDTTELRPSTIADLIADLVDSPIVNFHAVTSLLSQLEMTVGEEMSIEFLADAGIVPGRGALAYEVAE